MTYEILDLALDVHEKLYIMLAGCTISRMHQRIMLRRDFFASSHGKRLSQRA